MGGLGETGMGGKGGDWYGRLGGRLEWEGKGGTSIEGWGKTGMGGLGIRAWEPLEKLTF